MAENAEGGEGGTWQAGVQKMSCTAQPHAAMKPQPAVLQQGPESNNRTEKMETAWI